jgi:hypothetical protein
LENTRHSSVNGFRSSVVGFLGLGVNTRLKGSASDGPTNFQNKLPAPISRLPRLEPMNPGRKPGPLASFELA